MAVLPLDTERLHVRVMRPTDAYALAAYRSLDDIAKYQDWNMPYGVDDAIALLSDQADVDDVAAGTWIQIAIELQASEGLEREMIGDLAVGLNADGTVAHLGYTLAPAHHGRGYASEAAEALVDALFERGDVRRIVATLDPQNFASMRVIEQIGFTYEGLARQAELVRGEWVDDMRFGLLRADRLAWRTRPRTSPAEVRLVEILPGEASRWCRVETHKFQRQFVATVAESFADAVLPEIVDGMPLVPWFRGIEADGECAGFVMVSMVTEAHPHPYLWRMLIDRRYQRRGIAAAALGQLIATLRAQGHSHFYTSYTLEPGGPKPFYTGMGFAPNGDYDEDEEVAVLALR